MRWKITNTSVVAGEERITNTNKKLYVTVGDIVGMGKSASEAVKNAIVNVNSLIAGLKQDPALIGQVAGATMVQNLLTPLYVVIKGTEVYQKIMTVADIVTPIVKLIARGTGVWCSPGNAADIGQIVLGIVNEILVGLITSIIARLKNWIWNYEFLIKDINTASSEAITKMMNALGKELKIVVGRGFGGAGAFTTWMTGSNLTPDSASGSASFATFEKYKEAIGDLKSGLNAASALPIPSGTAQSLANSLAGKSPEYFSDYWVSAYAPPETAEGTLRLFRGSVNNKGIQYSDDGGKSWTQSKQVNKSFGCFAKINIGTEEKPRYRYLAGSIPYIAKENLVSITDSTWSKNEYGQYDKDYYMYNKTYGKTEKYTKFRKDSHNKNYYIAKEAKGCYSSDNSYVKGDGVYRSDDNGVTWIKCNSSDFENIGKLFEFKEKIGEPSRVVACDYDYKGIWYTEDGDNFSRSKIKRAAAGEFEDITYGRWNVVNDFDNDKIYGHPNAISARAIITAKVGILNHTSAKPITAKTSVIATIIDKIDDLYGALWRRIKLAIHKNYNISWDYYSAEFWADLRSRVFKGQYTWEDYEAGKDLKYKLQQE